MIILNSRQIKVLREEIINNFGFFFTEPDVFLQNDKGKVFLINRDISKLDFKKVRLDRIGLYVLTQEKKGIRLSKEGTQILAKQARENNVELKNVVELNKDQVKEYFKGLDLSMDLGNKSRPVLLSYKGEVFCQGKYKEGEILNYMPKIHRVNVIV